MDSYTGRIEITVAGSIKEVVQENGLDPSATFRALLHDWYPGLKFDPNKNTVLLERIDTSTQIVDELLNHVDSWMAKVSCN